MNWAIFLPIFQNELVRILFEISDCTFVFLGCLNISTSCHELIFRKFFVFSEAHQFDP